MDTASCPSIFHPCNKTAKKETKESLGLREIPESLASRENADQRVSPGTLGKKVPVVFPDRKALMVTEECPGTLAEGDQKETAG